MYIADKGNPNDTGLGGWTDAVGAGGWADKVGSFIGVAAQEVQAKRASETSRQASQARVAVAQANLEATKLALQAEALKRQSAPGSMSNTPVLLGIAALLSGGLAYLVLRRKRGR